MTNNYETVIGLEIHVQLGTKSKAFCSDSAAFGGSPNTHISPLSLGHPGTLPKINTKQIEYAVRLGLALNCTINLENRFDRKNYFYADLPKGYQLTQDAAPICLGGHLDVQVNGKTKRIRFHHIHMEEDAGKSSHDLDPNDSLIDLNRAGVPLLEIVTEPDMRSADEAYALITEIRKLVRYIGVSDGNMEEGSLRCDCNISVMPKGSKVFGNRCEVKNVNSMRNAKRAIEYEAKRQVEVLENGGFIQQNTLDFDAVTGKTSPLRSKENAHDYRYFPAPDLPPIVLTQAYVDAIKAEMPALPNALFQQFTTQYQLSEYDANILTETREIAEFYLALIQHTKNYKAAANWTINSVKAYLNEHKLDVNAFPISIDKLAELIALVDDNKVSLSVAKSKLFPAMIEHPKKSPLAIAEMLNLVQNSDVSVLEQFVDASIAKYPKKVAAYRKGKKGLLGFFMGDVMRSSKGKADPKVTNELLRKKLN